MPDALPSGISRADIERHIATHGVTVGPPAGWQPWPSAEDGERLRERLADLERRGRLKGPTVDRALSWHAKRGQLSERVRSRHADRVAKYRELARQGATVEEVMRALGVVRRTVESAEGRYDIRFRRNYAAARDARKERIADLHADGRANKEIAETLGINSGTVSKTLSRLGLKANVRAADGA